MFSLCLMPCPHTCHHLMRLKLFSFMSLTGTPINKPPVLGYKDLNLFKLFRLVYQLGGCHKVMPVFQSLNYLSVGAAPVDVVTLKCLKVHSFSLETVKLFPTRNITICCKTICDVAKMYTESNAVVEKHCISSIQDRFLCCQIQDEAVF